MTPRVMVALLALMLSLPCWAKKAPIEPSAALKHTELLMADAEKLGAPTLVPSLWLGALEKLNAAYAAFHKQVEAGARDEDDTEYVAALRAAEEAEVDAELTQVSAQAARDEARIGSPRRSNAPARTGGYQSTPSSDRFPAMGAQP
jgi:hypothetical protein